MHLRFIISSFAFSTALLLPVSAFAMRSQIFDFGAGQINATWEGKGPIEMKQVQDGIVLHATGTGYFLTETDLSVDPGAGSVTISSEQPGNVYLLWIYKNDTSHQNHTLEIAGLAGTKITTPFSLSTIQSWTNNSKQFGLILLPNTTILLHQIRFDELNAAEKLWERIRSFWVFDGIRTYSINFLWGPHLASDPVARQELFSFVPPQTPSATGVIYLGLLTMLVILMGFSKLSRSADSKHRLIVIGSSLLLAVWIIFDLRMGGEFLASIAYDAKSYIFRSEETRTFRDRDRFYDFATFAAPYVFDRASYIFLAERQWPYLGNMRYLTYPSIPGIAFDQDDTWIIYRRSDVSVSETGQLIIEGQAVTGAGKILGRFDDTSFVFRTFEKPASPEGRPTPPPAS